MATKLPRIKAEPQGRRRMSLHRIPDVAQDEGLTGIIQGLVASAPEERLAIALDENEMVQWFKFRQSYNAPNRNTAGAIELDFLITIMGVLVPAQVDEEYFHASADARAIDGFKDMVLNELLNPYGARRVSRIRADFLETIVSARLTVDALVWGRVFSLDDM